MSSGAEGGQNLITKISLSGGWYVDWMQITFLDGTEKEFGTRDNNNFANLTVATFNGEVITSVRAQTGAWLDGISFTTNVGQTVTMGCAPDRKTKCPQVWNQQFSLATQAQIDKAVGYMNVGRDKAWALDNSIVGTTSSGYLCGMKICSFDYSDWKLPISAPHPYIHSIQMFFMLPVVSMDANSTLELHTGSSSSTASSLVVTQQATSLCVAPLSNAGLVQISQSTQTLASLAIGNTYSTTYSKTITNGWNLEVTGTKGVKDVWMTAVKAAYSGSVSNTESNQQTASQTTTTTTSSGVSSTLTLNSLCPATVPSNTMCTWNYNAYSVTSWNSIAWKIPATFTLLGGKHFTNVLGGSSSSGNTAYNNATLTSVVCNGVDYTKEVLPIIMAAAEKL